MPKSVGTDLSAQKRQQKGVAELFGNDTRETRDDWKDLLDAATCPFLRRQCLKTRKSDPSVAMGTCSVLYDDAEPVVICPHRLIERSLIFQQCLHLLTSHVPENELHLVREVDIPGGAVDYCLVSLHDGKVADFVGIELQSLDSTGSVWPARQEFIKSLGISALIGEDEQQTFGMNWKMSAKTILMQLHHKVETFEAVNRKLVLVTQDKLLKYMKTNFTFGHLSSPATLADSLHFHAYRLDSGTQPYSLKLERRLSTDCEGVAKCLGLEGSARVAFETLAEQLLARITGDTVFRLDPDGP